MPAAEEEEHKDRCCGEHGEHEEREGVLGASTAEKEEEEPKARELHRNRGVADPPEEKKRAKPRAAMAEVEAPLMLSKGDRDRPEQIDREAAVKQEPDQRKTEADKIASDQKE